MASIDIHFYDQGGSELPPSPGQGGGGGQGTPPPNSPPPNPPQPTPPNNGGGNSGPLFPNQPSTTGQSISGQSAQPTSATLTVVANAIGQSTSMVMKTVLGNDPLMGQAVVAIRGLTQAISIVKELLHHQRSQDPSLPASPSQLFSGLGSGGGNQQLPTSGPSTNQPNENARVDWASYMRGGLRASRIAQQAGRWGRRFDQARSAGAAARSATGGSLQMTGSTAPQAATYASRVAGGRAALTAGTMTPGAATGAAGGAASGAAVAGALATGVGVIVAAFSAVAIGAAAAVKSFQIVRDQLLSAAEDVKGFSATLAMASARQRVSAVFDRINRANTVGPELAQLVELQTRINSTWSELGNSVIKVITPVVEAAGENLIVIMEFIGEIIRMMGPILTILTNLNSALMSFQRSGLGTILAAAKAINDWFYGEEDKVNATDEAMKAIERFMGGDIGDVPRRPDGRMF